MLPSSGGAWALASLQPDFWYANLRQARIHVGPMGLGEMMILFLFGIWVRVLQDTRAVPNPSSGTAPSRGNEVGVAPGLAGAPVAAWAPRGSAVVYGPVALGAHRRASNIHQDPQFHTGSHRA